MPEKLDLESKDLIAEKLEQLEKLFPNLVTEGENGKVLDLDQLKNEFSTEVVEGTKERYRLEWPGKKEAIVTANLPTTKTLRPVKEDSVDWDNTENLYIEGDNLEVLKILQESYFGKIKMIYIDPPYNTGKDFVYKDNFSKDAQEELEESGQKDEYNQRLFQNADTSGRYHSDWLSMMYPRLKLARNLLSSDGLIFVSINDVESHNLKKLLDEVFGNINFIGEFIWKARQIVDSRNKTKVSVDHETVLVFSKDIESAAVRGKEIDQGKYTNADSDERGSWMSNSILGLANASQRPNLHYEITDPETGHSYPCPPDSGWRYSRETMESKIKDGRIVFPKSIDGRPREKKFLREASSLYTGFSSILDESNGYTLNGSREVRDLFGDKYFDFPKPTTLLKNLITQGAFDENSIILDFFSGSGSSANAVMQLNAEDGGNRKHIMVQLPEACDEKSEAFKSGYKNICEIGKERIRRAGAKIKEETGADIDYGFRVYRLDDSNMADVYHTPQDYDQSNLELFADNVKEGRSADDLLAQIMLDWGLPLSLPIEETEVAGKRVFNVAGDSLMACFDTGIDETFAKEIAKEEPLRIVFKDAGFTSDTAKSNVQQLLRQLSPETEMRVI